jgi:hypothetical protein
MPYESAPPLVRVHELIHLVGVGDSRSERVSRQGMHHQGTVHCVKGRPCADRLIGPHCKAVAATHSRCTNATPQIGSRD